MSLSRNLIEQKKTTKETDTILSFSFHLNFATAAKVDFF